MRKNMQTITPTLAAHPFFKGLSGPQLDQLSHQAMPIDFPAGQMIFREGELANRFYLLLEGEVALESASQPAGGLATRVQTLGAGDVLGWSWLIPPHFWRFDARAMKPTQSIFIYGTRVRELCEEDHMLGYELMKRTSAVLIERLQATRRQLLKQAGIPKP